MSDGNEYASDCDPKLRPTYNLAKLHVQVEIQRSCGDPDAIIIRSVFHVAGVPIVFRARTISQPRSLCAAKRTGRDFEEEIEPRRSAVQAILPALSLHGKNQLSGLAVLFPIT